MKFGVFYELQLPKPWGPDDELRLVQDALTQVELADRLGIDYAWAVEHHFLEEYSHCSASEVFLAAAAARTQRIRLGHGIRQVILLARDVLPEFAERAAERDQRKADALAPHVEKALARKKSMAPLADADIPVVKASVSRPIVNT